MIKNTILYIALFIAVIIFSCSHKEHRYSINGTVSPEKNGDLIMLFKYHADSIYAVDTTIISNGTFKFSGAESLHDMAIITTGNYPNIVRATEVVLERGVINIHLDSIPEVKGTPLNELYSGFKKQTSKFVDDISALRQQETYLVDFYKNNVLNPVGRRAFKEYAANLHNEEIYQVYELVPQPYQSDPVISDLIKRCKEEDTKIKSAGDDLVGQRYTDFELFTPDKSRKYLSDYVGKSEFILIDFWASYSNLSIRKIPKRKAIYDKYKDKGFQIISISMDFRLEMWQDIINEVDAPWIHLSDLRDWSPLSNTYHMFRVPYSILLNKEGKIIKVHVQDSFLNEFLEESLS